jgi:uncharacterized protein YndB with AHSA1/START domain
VTEEPLRLSFDLTCSAAHAFHVWTSRLSRWWPSDHTVSGEAGADIVLEGRPGGRIFERTPAGVVHEWGEVTTWEPPRRLSYLWYLRHDRADASQVEIVFEELGPAVTRIEIVHSGWERLGAKAAELRRRNTAGWRGVMPHFIAACEAADLHEGGTS